MATYSTRRDKTSGSAGLDMAELAHTFRAPLLSYFSRRVRAREDAEELTQDVFLRLLKRPDLDSVTNLEGFVFVTAANLLKDFYRSGARRGRVEVVPLDGFDIASDQPSPHDIVEGRDRLGVLLEAIKELKPKCRAVFVLHRFEDLSHSEIAHRMGVSVSMVEKHLATAMAHLRKTMHDASAGGGDAND